MKKFLPYVLFLSLLVVSCKSQKDELSYFQNLTAPSGVIQGTDFDIRIVPDDELLVTVSSLVPEATPATKGNATIQNTAAILTYVVNKEGNITLPVIGKLHVAGMTLSDITKTIEEKVSENVKDPSVRVELMNFKVNVLGEVRSPHLIGVNRERFSILDAIASAGDLTEYGNRKSVLLIREENGVKTYHRIDLSDANIISSPYYYLKQNDVVYVEPNKIRQDNSRYNQNNAFKLSVASTIVGVASIIASLVIALTVK